MKDDQLESLIVVGGLMVLGAAIVNALVRERTEPMPTGASPQPPKRVAEGGFLLSSRVPKDERIVPILRTGGFGRLLR